MVCAFCHSTDGMHIMSAVAPTPEKNGPGKTFHARKLAGCMLRFSTVRETAPAFGFAPGDGRFAALQHARSIRIHCSQRYKNGMGATVWGSDLQVMPEAAAFANGVMARFLDISDTYLGQGGGHPSDVISALLAVAESTGAEARR